MFGRKRQKPLYTQYFNQPIPYHQSVHFYGQRTMPAQNSPSPQSAYNPYGSGMYMNAPAPSLFYNYPNGGGPVSNWNGSPDGYGHNQNISQLLFENPLQPQSEQSSNGYYPYGVPYQNMNPYPQQAHLAKSPAGFQSLLNSFKNQEGNIDVNKMIDTAGQMMNAVNQVSTMVKGLGGIFKA